MAAPCRHLFRLFILFRHTPPAFTPLPAIRYSFAAAFMILILPFFAAAFDMILPAIDIAIRLISLIFRCRFRRFSTPGSSLIALLAPSFFTDFRPLFDAATRYFAADLRCADTLPPPPILRHWLTPGCDYCRHYRHKNIARAAAARYAIAFTLKIDYLLPERHHFYATLPFREAPYCRHYY